MLAERMGIRITRTKKVFFQNGNVINSKYMLIDGDITLGEYDTLQHVIVALKKRYDQILYDVNDSRVLVPCALSEMEG
jgi:hypothetical protein